MKKQIFIFLLLLFSIVINAQENEKTSNPFKGTRFVNAQSANLAEKGELLLLIQHRFGDISGGLYQLFGLDQASMRIGFEYGFGDNINLGFGRSTFLKTYDAFGKIRIVQQSSTYPLTVVVTLAGSVPTLRDYFPEMNNSFADKYSGNLQLQLAKTFKNVGLQISPGVLKTGFLPSENNNFSIFTLGLGGSVKLSEKVSANIEYLHNFNDAFSNKRPLSAGVDLDTGGHLFQLVLSNSQQMFDQAIFSNLAGDWTKGKLFFGFNLIREFDINKPLDF